MEETVLEEQIEESKMLMQDSLEHLRSELKKLQAGKASPEIFSGILVSYYGSETPMSQVANISKADGRTLVIQPWEKSMLAPIEKAIFEANLGLTPQNDGDIVRISIPPLTQERRAELVKKIKSEGEKAKVSIRNARRDAMEAVKKAVKEGYPEDAGKRREDEIQKMTSDSEKEVERTVDTKEKDIMTI